MYWSLELGSANSMNMCPLDNLVDHPIETRAHAIEIAKAYITENRLGPSLYVRFARLHESNGKTDRVVWDAADDPDPAFSEWRSSK